jgi:hypothetical protein
MTTPPIPASVQAKIDELKRLETELGHLPPETWAIKELQRRTLDPDFPFHAAQMEQQTELLFGDICDELAELGLEPMAIADVVNGTVHYPGGPRYCDVSEVAESLGLTVTKVTSRAPPNDDSGSGPSGSGTPA